jgi:hypothetical protein
MFANWETWIILFRNPRKDDLGSRGAWERDGACDEDGLFRNLGREFEGRRFF